MVMTEEMPLGESALMVAFENLVKSIKTFRALLGEAEADLKDFNVAVQGFEAELEAVGAELGQMVGATRDVEDKLIYRELMAAEKVMQKQIEEIRADGRISERVALAMETSLQELLSEQAALLMSFSSSMRQ